MDYSRYAHIYDLEYRDYTLDLDFFLKQAQACQGPCLEVGVGTARVALHLAQNGIQVTGIDNDPAMLAHAFSKRDQLPQELASNLKLSQQDMRNFDLQQKFSLIYLPFREFMHLYRLEDQKRALLCFLRHLTPEGKLILNLYKPDWKSLAQSDWTEPQLVRQKHSDFLIEEKKQIVTLTTSTSFHKDQQLLVEERFYDVIDSQGRIVDRFFLLIKQRFFTLNELLLLLELCGFETISILDDFPGMTHTSDQEILLVAQPQSLKNWQDFSTKVADSLD